MDDAQRMNLGMHHTILSFNISAVHFSNIPTSCATLTSARFPYQRRISVHERLNKRLKRVKRRCEAGNKRNNKNVTSGRVFGRLECTANGR